MALAETARYTQRQAGCAYPAEHRFLFLKLFVILTVNENNQKKIALDQARAGRRREGERMKKIYENENEEPVLTPEQIIRKNEVSTALCKEILSVKQVCKDSQDFYNSKEWKSARAMTIARDNGMDVWEYLVTGRITYPERVDVHHIEELIEAPKLRSNLDNLVTVSHENHRLIDALYRKGNKQLIQGILKEYAAERNAVFFSHEEEVKEEEEEEDVSGEQLSLFDFGYDFGGIA